MSHSLSGPKASIVRLFRLEPAVVRSTLVGITAIIAALSGKAIDPGWIENVLFAYAAVSPIVAGLFIRSAVTPNKRAEWTVGNIIRRVREEAGVVVDIQNGSVVFPKRDTDGQ